MSREAKASLNLDIAEKLCEVEDLCKSYGLPRLTRFTLIARDPENDEMVVVVTNEPGGYGPALEAARKQMGRDPVQPTLADALLR